MVPGNFSRFILVHWTRPTLKYANYMVPPAVFLFHFSPWTSPDSKICRECTQVPGSFFVSFSPLARQTLKIIC